MSRDLTTLGLFVLIFLIFGKSDIVKWSDRPKGASFSGHFGLVIKKNLHILYLDTEARKVFTPEPFTAFRTSRNLRSYLVRAKVPPLVREKGCKKCNKPSCLTCNKPRGFGGQVVSALAFHL